MIELVAHSGGVQGGVVDEALGGEVRDELWWLARQVSLDPITEGPARRSDFRIGDGVSFYSDVLGDAALNSQQSGALMRLTDLAEKVLLDIGVDVSGCSVGARVYAYPASTGLGWHIDAGSGDGRTRGAFTYYLNPSWGARWGGELLLADRIVGIRAGLSDTRAASDGAGLSLQRAHNDLAWDREEEVVESICAGTFVLPKSDRLVVIPPDIPHCVRPVTSAAGENLRVAIAGFFRAPRSIRD